MHVQTCLYSDIWDWPVMAWTCLPQGNHGGNNKKANESMHQRLKWLVPVRHYARTCSIFIAAPPCASVCLCRSGGKATGLWPSIQLVVGVSLMLEDWWSLALPSARQSCDNNATSQLGLPTRSVTRFWFGIRFTDESLMAQL